MKTTVRLLGAVLVMVTLLTGCSNDDENSENPAIAIPEAPIGTAIQFFGDGATIGDIAVEGQNIKWYLYNPKDFAKFAQQKSYYQIVLDDDNNFVPQNVELPKYFKLRNGVTYYATQTVNNVESQNTLQVLTFIGIKKNN
jgi:hypothetical protein